MNAIAARAESSDSFNEKYLQVLLKTKELVQKEEEEADLKTEWNSPVHGVNKPDGTLHVTADNS